MPNPHTAKGEKALLSETKVFCINCRFYVAIDPGAEGRKKIQVCRFTAETVFSPICVQWFRYKDYCRTKNRNNDCGDFLQKPSSFRAWEEED